MLMLVQTVGMGVANQNQIVSTGCQKFDATACAISATFKSYAQAVGKYLLFGIVRFQAAVSWNISRTESCLAVNKSLNALRSSFDCPQECAFVKYLKKMRHRLLSSPCWFAPVKFRSTPILPLKN